MLAGLSLDYSGRMRLCGCLGKARRGQPSPTAVGRYCDSHAARPTKALAAILTKYAKRIAAKSAKRLGKVFDPDQPRDDHGRWGDGERVHVTAARESISHEGFKSGVGGGVGIGVGETTGNVFTHTSLDEARHLQATMQALEDIRVSDNPISEAVKLTGRPKEWILDRGGMFSRGSTDPRVVALHGAASALGGYVPARSFNISGPRRQFEIAHVDVSGGERVREKDGVEEWAPHSVRLTGITKVGTKDVAHVGRLKRALLASLTKVFDPDQPRDDHGRWGEGDGPATREPVTQTAEFKAWFGNSKVVDPAGKPLIVYHGTNEDFTTFRPSARSKEPGIFFAPDPAIASLYTGFDPGGNFHAEEVGSVLPVYLRIENPLVVDFDGSKTGRTEAFKRAIEGGHDGVLLRNHYDAGGVQDQWAVFKPEQIKSAIGNSGRFDPKSPDITKALTKAEDDDLKMILAALEDEMTDMSAEMRLALATEMLAAFRRAGTVGVMQAGFAMTPEIVKQLDEKARAFAEERGGWLIKNLAGTTIENLRATLARGVEEGMSADDLSDAIQEAGAFGEFRADMIARTELAFAHVQGNVEGWRITGEVELKRSILGDLHDIDDECDEAVDAGDIPLEDEFIDGYAFPPYHPNCICDVLPILREGQDGEG